MLKKMGEIEHHEIDRRLTAVERYQERMAHELNLLQQHQAASDQIMAGLQQGQRDLLERHTALADRISSMNERHHEMMLAQAITRTKLTLVVGLIVAVATGIGGVLSAYITHAMNL